MKCRQWPRMQNKREQGDFKDDGLYTIYVVKRINGNLLL
jgi:hypothetical protein